MLKSRIAAAAAAAVAFYCLFVAVNAVARGEGRGGVFVVAVGLFVVCGVLFGALAVRLTRRRPH